MSCWFPGGWSWPVARDEGLTQKGSFVNLHPQGAAGPCQGLGSKYGGKYDSLASVLLLSPHVCLLRSSVKCNQGRIRSQCMGSGTAGGQAVQGCRGAGAAVYPHHPLTPHHRCIHDAGTPFMASSLTAFLFSTLNQGPPTKCYYRSFWAFSPRGWCVPVC